MDRKKVEDVVEELQPQLEIEGFELELVDFDEEGSVKVKLSEACDVGGRSMGCGCGPQALSACSCGGGISEGIQWVVEDILKKEVPELESVEVV